MKAIVFDTYGSPDVLRVADLEKPQAKANEVLIRVHASVATPPDCAFRSANPFMVRFFMGLTKPKFNVMGGALAGVVEAAGDAVTAFKPGDRVYGASDADFGACAEYKALPEDGSLAILPDAVSFAEGVALSEGFLTALPFLRDEAKLERGQRVLINGASGSIGTVAVQLAKLMGAEVTGVCSGRNAELVKSLGADEVIDYTEADFTAARGRYDVIFDTVGKSSFARCKDALRPGGVYLTTVISVRNILDTLLTRKKAKRAIFATTGLRPAEAKARDLAYLSELVAAGALRPVIDRTYPLEETAEAHCYVETGRKVGSVVISLQHLLPEGGAERPVAAG